MYYTQSVVGAIAKYGKRYMYTRRWKNLNREFPFA
jgi:hypothetical protein